MFTFVYMDAIVNQIKSILESKDISASEFADIMGVKRANVSHVLSGRNKPSLEFVVKFCEAFEEVDLNTLLLQKESSKIFENPVEEKVEIPLSKNLNSSSFEKPKKNEGKEIDRIVLFFKDGSFKEFNNHDNT